MVYQIQKLSDLPVILGTWHEGFKVMEVGDQYAREIRAAFDTTKTPAFYVLDMTDLQSITLDGLVKASNIGADSELGTLHHPMNLGTIFISDKVLIQLIAKGMDSDAFGHLNVKLFASLDEALAYVESQL